MVTMANSQETKDSTKKRSSPYPSMTLEKGIRIMEIIRKKLGNGPYDRLSIAQSLGFKTVSGPTAQKIASLVYFGLLNRTVNAYRQSELSEKIFLQTSESEKEIAIKEAAQTPKLYSDLITKFTNNSLPELLTNILAREFRISEKIGKKVEADFRQTLEFAGLIQNGVVTTESSNEKQKLSAGKQEESNVTHPNESEPESQTFKTLDQDFDYFEVTLTNGKAKFKLPKLEGNDLKKLIVYLKTTAGVFEDDHGGDASGQAVP